MQQDITIVRGDDYKETELRQIIWQPADPSTWPDLTGATRLLFRAVSDFDELEATPTVQDAGFDDQRIELELTSDETLVASGRYRYDVEVVLASGSVFTAARGELVVELTYTSPQGQTT
jgi:hypothetical protein